MSEEDQTVDVMVLPKFDMPFYESTMSAKDVKCLAIRHDIPLDLHPCALIEGLDNVPSVNLFRVFYKVSKQRHWFSFEKRVCKGASGDKKRDGDAGEGSRPKVKRRKVPAARRDGSAASEHVSSPEPIRTVDPTRHDVRNPPLTGVGTAESLEDHSFHIPPHDSANDSVHNNTKVYMLRKVSPPVLRPWPSLLWLEEPWLKLIILRVDLELNAKLYNDMASRYKKVKEEHEGCANKIKCWKKREMNYPISTKIKLSILRSWKPNWLRRTSVCYCVRLKDISAERGEEKEKLVTQLGRTEMKKFDCVRKLLPTVVGRLFCRSPLIWPFKPDGLFKMLYPYIEKIARGFRHSAAELLKVHPDPHPPSQAPAAIIVRVLDQTSAPSSKAYAVIDAAMLPSGVYIVYCLRLVAFVCPKDFGAVHPDFSLRPVARGHRFIMDDLNITMKNTSDSKKKRLKDMVEHLIGKLPHIGEARGRMTWRQFILALGLHTEVEMEHAGFGAYWQGTHFGLVSDQGLRGLPVVTRELPLIDFHELERLNIYLKIGDTWAWVAPGPERLPDAAAGAPGAAEDAPAVDEGAQADPTLV
ncbi:hypothetical protein Tco_1503216 [Tanacetum coccineum]